MTAQSATGTCHGPTIWSLATVPVTLRSPIVIKKLLLATVGCFNTRSIASLIEIPEKSNEVKADRMDCIFLCILGGLPNNTDIGKSIGLSPKCLSESTICLFVVDSPTMAYGHRSRWQIASNTAILSGLIAITYRSCASLHQMARGDMPNSSLGIFLSSNFPPHPPSLTSSGKALDRPPAPTS